MKKIDKKQLFCNLVCCIMSAIPLICNCQTDINETIYMETYEEGDTVRFYYDENDNKILHGKQVNVDFWLKKECNYKHGVLDGEYSKTWEYEYGVGKKIIGFYKDGVADSFWVDYRYSEETNQLEIFHWEEWGNGELLRISNNKADIHLHPVINNGKIVEKPLIYNGVIALYNRLIEINEDGIVTNVFLRQNGDIESFNEEMKKLMDTYLETKNDSIFLQTNFRITTVYLDNYCIYDYDSHLHKEKEKPMGCPDIKVKILKRIKYTPVEEIIKSLSNLFNVYENVISLNRFGIYNRQDAISNIRKNFCFPLGGYTFPSNSYLYWDNYCYINPNDIDIFEKYIKELEEEEQRKNEVSNLLNTINNLERESYVIKLRQYIGNNTYVNIRSTMVKKSYKNITEKDVELLRAYVKFLEDIKASEGISVKFNNNDKKIKELAYKNCYDILNVYKKEVSNNPSQTFNTISEFYKLVNDYEIAIKKQEDFIKYLTKRETIKNKEISFYQNATNYKHLVKSYEEYKNTFDLSWSNNSDWYNRLNEFEGNQNEYIRCSNLLEKIKDKDIEIIEGAKNLKRIKKAYSEYKKTLNFKTIPHVDKNELLDEFIVFQTKVLNNIKSKGEEVNNNLKKVKELNNKIEILTH